jgi:CRISPR system Cascade subunit CasA
MTATFNLASDPWVPVYHRYGANALASLRDIFTDESIVDLNVDPCERIALTRLLLAVAHRALDLAGQHPKKSERTEIIRERLISPAQAYLSSRETNFDLGDEHSGFLRLSNVTAEVPPETPAADYLNFQKRFKPKSLTSAQIALGITTFHCCYPGGLCARNLKIDGESILATSAECSPPMKRGPIYSFLIGETILDTIALNLLPLNKIPFPLGVPAWEEFSDNTFLGRILPIAYSIAFGPGFSCMSYGALPYKFSNGHRDPWLSYRKKDDRYDVVRISKERSLWRELQNLCAIPDKDDISGSKLLQQRDFPTGTQLWVGGMAKDQSKIEGLIEDRFDISEAILSCLRTEDGLKAFQYTDIVAGNLVDAVKSYETLVRYLNPKKTAFKLIDDARMRYWNRIDIQKHVLFDILNNGKPREKWVKICNAISLTILDEVCPCPLTSSREYRAISKATEQLKSWQH